MGISRFVKGLLLFPVTLFQLGLTMSIGDLGVDPLASLKLNTNSSDPTGVEMETCFNSPTGPNATFPEMHMKATGIIKHHGFHSQSHRVTTEDGYILELHRIPSRLPGSARKYPVLLQHGNMGSSVNWILPSGETALAYRLSTLGYDIWMGNVRETSYSLDHAHPHKQHTTGEYWNFSWHEMGVYDVPAKIDYILKATGSPKLYYIGHSMGCTMYFVCMSLRPEYNAKVEMMFALAPVVFLSNMSFFSLNLMAPFSYSLQNFYQFMGGGRIMIELLRRVLFASLGHCCQMSTTINCVLCSNIYYMLFNSDGKQTNHTMLPIVKHHFPDSASTKTLTHYLQNTITGKFQQFDPRFAFPGGPNAYPEKQPEEYNLTKVTSPVVIFHAPRDNIANPTDVGKLARMLPNVRAMVEVCYPYFNHVDFLYGVDVNTLVYDKLIHILENGGRVNHEHLDLGCKKPLKKRNNIRAGPDCNEISLLLFNVTNVSATLCHF